ncbi:VanZ family protein [Candidatus Magnetaquicoccus inordinatus]|uniref:VanZ family protein n=1 Tax=Candidatus Magnetaquicoccus inordinatus TaxID=2496818 RepID=UPI00187D35E8|nr:VanZ family protein [Candidatus Magnetaquicoccus inordinatus]
MNLTIWARICWPLLLLGYSALIYSLSSAPILLPGPGFPLKDKLLHFLGYALLAALAWQSGRSWQLRASSWYAWGYAALYGISDEWHQYYVPGRSAEVADWLADSLGAACVVALLAWRERKKQQGGA